MIYDVRQDWTSGKACTTDIVMSYTIYTTDRCEH